MVRASPKGVSASCSGSSPAARANCSGVRGGTASSSSRPVAGGTTALGQRLLEAVLGDSAVRSLADRAREDLLSRTDRLLQTERDRFDARIAAAAPADGVASGLRAAAAELVAAVRAGR